MQPIDDTIVSQSLYCKSRVATNECGIVSTGALGPRSRDLMIYGWLYLEGAKGKYLLNNVFVLDLDAERLNKTSRFYDVSPSCIE